MAWLLKFIYIHLRRFLIEDWKLPLNNKMMGLEMFRNEVKEGLNGEQIHEPTKKESSYHHD